MFLLGFTVLYRAPCRQNFRLELLLAGNESSIAPQGDDLPQGGVRIDGMIQHRMLVKQFNYVGN